MVASRRWPLRVSGSAEGGKGARYRQEQPENYVRLRQVSTECQRTSEPTRYVCDGWGIPLSIALRDSGKSIAKDRFQGQMPRSMSSAPHFRDGAGAELRRAADKANGLQADCQCGWSMRVLLR